MHMVDIDYHRIKKIIQYLIPGGYKHEEKQHIFLTVQSPSTPLHFRVNRMEP